MTQIRKFKEQAVPPWRRAVLKVGSSLLAAADGGLATRYALGLAQFITACHASGREIVLVSSGAVAAGRMLLKEHSNDDTSSAARQAMAALGQTHTVALWQRLLDRPLAQVLLTHDDLRDRRRYLNARSTLRELLTLGVMPVVNENDTVAIDELTLGDNDNLAAIVAALVDADLLLIATDIDGLFTTDPRFSEDARPIDEVSELTPEIMAMAGAAGTSHGTGGMRTKLEAAEKAAAAGIETILFNGCDNEVVGMLSRDLLRGTRLRTGSSRLKERKYWLRHAPAAKGCIRVDDGASIAISSGGASLLPRGIIAADGDFHRGDVVEILGGTEDSPYPVGRGITQYGAAEINRIVGCHSREIVDRLGYTYGEPVMHRDDLATHDPHNEELVSRKPGVSP
jgi:glutamate 5-kinase